MTLLLLASCFEASTEPPVVESVDMSCESDTLSLRIIARDDNAVTNTSVGELLPEWVSGEALSVWTLEFSQDCESPWADDLLLSNAIGMTTTERLTWPQEPPTGLQLTPAYGSTAGGNTLSITGSGLGTVDQVWFGETAATIVSTSLSELVIESPAGPAGQVSVTVAAGEVETEIEEPYVYWEDGTGRWGGISRPWVYIYEPSLFSIGSAYATIDYGSFFQVDTLWHQPVDIEQTYWGNAPGVGECGWTGDAAWDAYDAGSYVLAGDLALSQSGTVYWSVTDQIDPADYAGQVWDVELPGGELPAMVLPDAMALPEQPTNTSYDWTVQNPHTWGEDLVLSWDSGVYDGVRVTVHASRGSSALSSWVCSYETDTGVTLAWDDIVAGADASQVDTVHLAIAFWQDTYTEMPHDNSTYWTQGQLQYWVEFPLTAP